MSGATPIIVMPVSMGEIESRQLRMTRRKRDARVNIDMLVPKVF